MINDESLRKALYSWIIKFVDNGVTVFWENQAEQRPQKPYVSMNFLTGPIKTGTDDWETNGDGTTRVSGPRQVNFSINYFGQQAMGKLSRVQGSFELPSCPVYFNPLKMAYISDSGVRDLTQVQENRFETRAQMDVRFSTIAEMTDTTTDIIETVVLENELDNTETVINP